MSTKPGPVRRPFPELVYNPITTIGGMLALFGLASVIILTAISYFQKSSSPYIGIFTLVLFPSILVVGLILIPIGMVLEKRRRDRGEIREFIFNLQNARHRNALTFFGVGTAIFLLLTTVGLFQTYQFTESTKFCGEVCHTVMAPENTTHEASAHARVACVHCHVGPGGQYYVKSKMEGARQLFALATQSYHKPIETPVYTLRPAQETCLECHWPQKFYSPRVNIFDHYLSDEQNSHWQIRMLFNIGGPLIKGAHAGGIHWHIMEGNKITLVANDSTRQGFESITWYNEGRPVTYTLSGQPLSAARLAEKEAKGMIRTMDCVDCHNRPSHRYKSPMEMVNEAMTQGRIDAGLPFIKREAVRVLSEEYATPGAAHAGITTALTAFYTGRGLPAPTATIAAVIDEFDHNMFPDMKIRWTEYPENQGHMIYPGCFRCHGSDLKTAEGRTIRNDCNLCHVIYAQGPVTATADSLTTIGKPFQHPIDIGGAETGMKCTDCHAGDAGLYKVAGDETPGPAMAVVEGGK